ncbi:MAG: Holliday junction resolvase RuvX [Actinomycetes bacterium]
MLIGRRLAFDYGDVRIGIAISDLGGILASPLTTLLAKSDDLESNLKELIVEFNPIYIIVGNPLHLSGRDSAKSESAKNFLNLLTTLTDARLFSVDERLSTVSALKTLKSSGINAKQAKGRVDEMAAVAILEQALDQERLTGRINGIAL